MSKRNTETSVHDGGDMRKYRAEIPNVVFTLGLTPFELALYTHLKQTAGAGEGGRSTKSTEKLAREAGMSEGMVSKAKQGLLRADRPALRGKALIHIEKDETRPGRPRDVITIVDIWPENFLFFAPQSSPQSSPHELQSSPQSSPHEAKKESEERIFEERTEEALNVRPPLEKARANETAPPGDRTPAPTPNAEDPVLQTSPPERTAPAPDPPPEPPPGRNFLTNGRKNQPGDTAAARLRRADVDRVVELTGDARSRLRFEEIYDRADGAGLLTLWEKARQQTRKAVLAGTAKSPGAYFNALAAKMLNEAHPGLVPVGSREERNEVRGAIRESLSATEMEVKGLPPIPGVPEVTGL